MLDNLAIILESFLGRGRGSRLSTRTPTTGYALGCSVLEFKSKSALSREKIQIYAPK